MAHGSQKRLADLVASLSDEQQNAVEGFIRYLRERIPKRDITDVRPAVDEFVRDHSELLRRLEQ